MDARRRNHARLSGHNGTIVISFTLPPDVIDFLDHVAEQQGISRSYALAKIIADHPSFVDQLIPDPIDT